MYTNYLSLAEKSADQNYDPSFDATRVFWYKYGGIKSPVFTDRIHWFHQLPNIVELSTLSAEFINERDVVTSGYKRTTINDGSQFSATITFRGDDVITLAAMLGQHLHNNDIDGLNTNAAIEHGRDYGIQGALIVMSGSSSKTLVQSRILTKVTLRVLQATGSTDGTNTYEVELTSRGKLYTAPKGHVFVPLMYHQDGASIVNANAPNGVLTDFDLKNCNGSGVDQAAALLAQTIVADLAGGSNPEQYILDMQIDGSFITSEAFSFTQTTGVLAFNIAPADGSKLEFVVCLPSGFENHVAGGTYRAGQIVYYDGSYYRCKAASPTTELPTVIADWDVLTDQEFQIPLFNGADGAGFYTTTTPNYPEISWLDFQAVTN